MRKVALGLVFALACGSNSYRDFANKCALPRSGVDPYNGGVYADRRGTTDDEKSFVRLWEEDTYLWYSELPNLNPASYSTVGPYFLDLHTRALTPSGAPKDQIHFLLPTGEWEKHLSGLETGYGVTWASVDPKSLDARVLYVEPNSPASDPAVNLGRGARVVIVDNASVSNGDSKVVLAGLLPASVGETHTFSVLDRGGSTPRAVTMTSAAVASTPVPKVGLIAGTTVGYLLFNAHIPAAERGLVEAVASLKSAGVTDLILDVRYNEGGEQIISAELAYMIAGPSRTAGKTFERNEFNDKYPTTDPLTGKANSPVPFVSTGQSLSVPVSEALPHLDLDRVFVLTSGKTCSASEGVINGLLGIDFSVVLIGSRTCGKPYGYDPRDNCGTTYFAIQFRALNQKGFGDYADGFVPGAGGPAGPPGCLVGSDDTAHDLGDPAETRVAAALAYRNNATCPPAQSSAVEPRILPSPMATRLR